MKLSFNYAKFYQTYHRDNPKHFSGKMASDQVQNVARLVEWARPDRILDYGSGKGYQYLEKRVHEAWGGLLPYCYDPGVIQIQVKPAGVFQGVICSDVMEHIAENDVDIVLADIAESLDKSRRAFAYFHISTRPAGKSFPDGQNVHLTVKPESWWMRKIMAHLNQPDLNVVVTYGD
jgi:hypothetical protein